LEDYIFVMRDENSPCPPWEKHDEGPDGGDNRWHAIAQRPVAKPPVSKLFVSVLQLEEWGDDWEELHLEHLDARIFEDKDVTLESEDRRGNPNKLVRCCGRERPHASVPLEVRAFDDPFVTIHDFLTAVHPWLMEQCEIISLVMSVDSAFATPLSESTNLASHRFLVKLLIVRDLKHFVTSNIY
jgi:hypothetical protein